MAKKKEQLPETFEEKFGDHGHEGRFMPALDHVYATYEESLEDGTIRLQEYMHMTGDVMHCAEVAIVGIGDEQAGFEALVSDMKEAFVKYVDPYNLSFIPDWAEKWGKEQFKNNIRTVLEGMRAAVLKW